MPPVRSKAGPYTMAERLLCEKQHKPLVEVLFAGYAFSDISESVRERKSGTDFLLSLEQGAGLPHKEIRCENKFEQYVSKRITLEWVSVDRPKLVPGWMVTSQAAWLLSWFPSGEVLVLPMDELRTLVLPAPDRYCATTTANNRYLSWNTLEDVNYVVRELDNARVLDLKAELGLTFSAAPMLSPALRSKRVSVPDLVEHMARLPGSSQPLALAQDQLESIARKLAPLDFRRAMHRTRLDALPWLDNAGEKGEPRNAAQRRYDPRIL